MDTRIRDAIDESIKELKNMQDKVEGFIDDLPDDTQEIKRATKSALDHLGAVLTKVVDQAGNTAEEAQLQAHLGVMEAKDKLDASRVVLDDVLARSAEESKKILDEVELKQHLAKMEAQDFWDERGSKLAEEFQASAADMQDLAEKAASELSSAFTQWNEQFKSRK